MSVLSQRRVKGLLMPDEFVTAKQRPICGARLRNDPSKVCQSTLKMPNGRCRVHGGATPRGIASPHFKTGRYSKNLPSHLLEAYKVAVQDDDLLAVREDVALIDVRLGELVGLLDHGADESTWARLGGLWSKYQAAFVSSDTTTADQALAEIGDLIANGGRDYNTWREIQAVLEQRRKLVESEQRRLVTLQQTITVEQAMLFVAAVMDSVRTHVTDRHTLAAVAADLDRLAVRPRSGAALSISERSRS